MTPTSPIIGAMAYALLGGMLITAGSIILCDIADRIFKRFK